MLLCWFTSFFSRPTTIKSTFPVSFHILSEKSKFTPYPLMRGACGHSCNHSRLRSKRPAEQGGPVDGARRTSQRSRVSDLEPNIAIPPSNGADQSEHSG